MFSTIPFLSCSDSEDKNILNDTSWSYAGYYVDNSKTQFIETEFYVKLEFTGNNLNGIINNHPFSLGYYETSGNGALNFLSSIKFTDIGNVDEELEKFVYNLYIDVKRFTVINDSLMFYLNSKNEIKIFIKLK